MSDEVKAEKVAPLITDELKTIIEGTEKKLFIADSEGQEHRLLPLTMNDLLDFEDNIGTSIYNMPTFDIKIKHIMYLLYLSIRKEGCSKEDLQRRKYKYTERQVGDMFSLGFMKSAMQCFSDILVISGLQRKEDRPQEPSSQEKDTMPEEGPRKA